MQEHEGKAGNGVSLQHHRCVLPVAVFLHPIDIFICQIYAAGKSGVSVDDHDLAVIPKVIVGGDKGQDRGEHFALDPQLIQLLGIVVGQSGEFTGAVVHDPHIHTLLHFSS